MNTSKNRYDWLSINGFKLNTKNTRYIYFDNPHTLFGVNSSLVEYGDDEEWEKFVDSYHEWIGKNG